ncbi:MAG TPA: HAD-IIA family hydrolase [Armatimonadota bacterium]|jgi:phosphoglycolate/pyridoxal phosphate phosphatase family enzyme
MSARPLGDYAGYVFDLDGTLYLGEHLIPGADRALAALRAAGKRVAFISNKPLGRAAEYAAKLTRLGLPADPTEVVNSPVALRWYLEQAHPGASVFLLGEDPVREELERGGLRLTEDPAAAQVVVVSWDRQVDYERLNRALQALRRGAAFVATNPDVTCPLPGGEQALDAGSFVALLEAACGRRVEAIAGKPSPLMLEMILRQWQIAPADCLLLGDRLETDLALGRRAGAAVALVLTGVATREAVAAHAEQPDYVLASVAELGGLS